MKGFHEKVVDFPVSFTARIWFAGFLFSWLFMRRDQLSRRRGRGEVVRTWGRSSLCRSFLRRSSSTTCPKNRKTNKKSYFKPDKIEQNANRIASCFCSSGGAGRVVKERETTKQWKSAEELAGSPLLKERVWEKKNSRHLLHSFSLHDVEWTDRKEIKIQGTGGAGDNFSLEWRKVSFMCTIDEKHLVVTDAFSNCLRDRRRGPFVPPFFTCVVFRIARIAQRKGPIPSLGSFPRLVDPLPFFRTDD